ncbi:MAG: hypothetical protein IGS03_12670 [Candidatus Sericytochromatia bacterium]|nr:hypothetical protein [Candidatus Sericytochromatia bacterium]
MKAIFADTADFDPASFKMPAGLVDSQGPALCDIPEPPPAVQRLSQQVQREEARKQEAPSAENQAVAARLKQNLQLSASEGRAERLKSMLVRLKALPAEPEGLHEGLMRVIASLKSCYAGADAPRDLATMSVLHPLLQCQACKWDALKAGGAAQVPEAEAGYLKKLRSLQGSSLAPLERATLLQLILALNQQLCTSTAAESTGETPATPPAVSSAPVASFDPIQASRLMLQLRAKIQRTHSPAEKQALQAQLEALQAQQVAFFAMRQLQALARQSQELAGDCSKLAQARAEHFSQWRPLRLKSLQNLSRLLGQPPACPAGVSLLESAQQQLARLDLPGGHQWIAQEQARQRDGWAAAREGLAPELAQALTDWLQQFDTLMQTLQQACQHWAQKRRKAEQQTLLNSLAQAQQDWVLQETEIKALESRYLQCEDPVARRQLQQTLLNAYAEVLAMLPAL